MGYLDIRAAEYDAFKREKARILFGVYNKEGGQMIGTGNPQPARMSEIFELMSMIDGETGRLVEVSQKLYQRLDPVMRADDAKPGNEKIAPPRETVVGTRLQQTLSTVQSACEMLERILTRLEI